MSKASNLKWLIAFLAFSLVTACQKGEPVPETSIAHFTATPASVERGASIVLSWKAEHFGVRAGTPSCTLARQPAGEPWGAPFEVACEGSITEVPAAPATAAQISYRLQVLRQPFRADDPFLSQVVAVSLADPPRVVGVTIDPVALELAVGDVASLSAEVVVEGGASTAVDWSSSDATVVTVDDTGQVRAQGVGSATITAASAFDPTKRDDVTATVLATGNLRWSWTAGAAGDGVGGIAVDPNDDLVVALSTSGSHWGPSAGGVDVAIAKFTRDGTLLWSRQFGSDVADRASGVAVDASGNVFVTGWTEGDLADANAGERDVFVAKYDPNGVRLWQRQFGTASMDASTAIASDATGNVVVGGYTQGELTDEPNPSFYPNGFVAAFTPDGALLRVYQFGSYPSDEVSSVARGPDGAVAVAVDGYRATGYVMVLDAVFNVEWRDEYGTYHSARAVAFDADGNLLVTGSRTENPFAIPFTAYLFKYDGATRVWERSLGPDEGSSGYRLAADATGNVRVAGNTSGSLGGENPDAPNFLMNYDAAGNRVWARQFGPSVDGMAVDGVGNTVVASTTAGGIEVKAFAP